jgi:beta-phosphoglucomutase family hydrolase
VGASVLGLPDGVTACLFDLDGVLTQTARLHAAAWKRMFDDFLQGRAQREQPFVPFDEVTDYEQYVDGLPRYDGVASFLHSRGIELAQGTAQDSPDAETIHGLGNRKNEIVLSMIEHEGVEPYAGSIEYVRAARLAGMGAAVVSSSVNAHAVLLAAGIEDLFEAIVDGALAEREHLRGKPAPDTYLAGARALGAEPRNAAVFEDALAGVEAGRAGRFGIVVGVDRLGQAEALRAHGADIVIADLSELLRAP